MENNEQRTAWLIYGAILSALVIYGALGFFLPRLISSGSNTLLPILTPVFLAVAMMETILLLAWAPRLAGKMSYMSYCIIRWAMAEAIGICGLVLSFFGVGQGLFLAFLGWALVLMLLCAPTEADREKFELLKRGKP